MPQSRDITVLVSSCDPYADLWKPFFTLFWRAWPDCPFPVCLASDALSYADPGVRSLPMGGDPRDWSGRLLKALTVIPSRYVLLVLDDFFFRSRVSTADVLSAFDDFVRREGRVLRLVPRPGPDVRRHEGWFGEVRPGSPYRVSTQGAIWRRDELEWLLRSGESIWEFELKGTERSTGHPDGYYATSQPLLTYGHHVVERGKWFPWEARRYRAMDIGCDFQRRKIMSSGEALKWIFWKLLSYRQLLARMVR